MHRRTWFIFLICLLACVGCGKRQKSTDELIADLDSSEANDRVIAIRLLETRKGDPARVVPAMIKALKDKEDDVRWGAANGLGYYGAEAKEAIPALKEVQEHDSDARVRDAARVALGRIDPSLASPAKTRGK